MGLALLLLLAATGSARDRVAYIEFFGYQGIDIEAVRKALPVHEGDALNGRTVQRIRDAVRHATGRMPEVGIVCCTNDGGRTVTIGLAIERPQLFHAAPHEKVRVSSRLAKLHHVMDRAEMAAAEQGRPEEEQKVGYRLLKADAASRTAELAVREYVLAHQDEVTHVLTSAASAQQRAIAADCLGFGRQTPEQRAALLEAVLDPNDEVRNQATRALGEILEADNSLAMYLSPDPFLAVLRFGDAGTDRNKSTWMLELLTRSRDAKLLARIKSEAWEPVMEIARWRLTGWAAAPLIILCRIQGVPEERIPGLAFGSEQAFLEAVQ